MITFGLVGHPLGHSFSQKYFTEKFSHENIDVRYLNFDIPGIDELSEVLRQHPELKGFNVTIPYKMDVIPLLTSISDEARAIGAVNVVKVNNDGERISLSGYNTDVVGFRDSLLPLLPPHPVKALVLGTGGASKAVVHALESLGIEWVYVSRTERPGAFVYSDLNEAVMDSHKLIVNATPLGMWPHTDEAPPIPYDYLTPEHVCYDLVYNPEITEFIRRARLQGATAVNGLEMLHRQAEAAWLIWNDKTKD